MQITSESHGDLLELHVSGRLDAEWAPTLWTAIEDALRRGLHSLVVDLSGVTYASSAGLAVLVRARQQFQAIRGFFGVGNPQPQIAEVLKLSGLAKLLLCDLKTARSARGRIEGTIQVPAGLRVGRGAAFEAYDLQPSRPMTCQAIGDPTQFDRGRYSAAAEWTFGEQTGGVGLGGFGESFAECARRCGELTALGGTVVQLPAGGTATPDFQSQRGEFIPKAHLLYGLRWSGEFSQLLRFESDEPERPLTLSSLAEQALELCRADAAVISIVAETAGLVGAALLQSPMAAPADGGSRFDHPEVREWIAFAPERVWPRSLPLICGVAARRPLTDRLRPLEPFLRPLSHAGTIDGHFHAVVFPFRAFKKRRLDLEDVVGTLFDESQPQALLHLLHDERPIVGAGDSEFLRGACWVGPLESVQEAAHDAAA
jgi:anti-anti-sigma factor